MWCRASALPVLTATYSMGFGPSANETFPLGLMRGFFVSPLTTSTAEFESEELRRPLNCVFHRVSRSSGEETSGSNTDTLDPRG